MKDHDVYRCWPSLQRYYSTTISRPSTETNCFDWMKKMAHISRFIIIIILFPGLVCEREFDKYACWPDGLPNTTVSVSCPWYLPWYNKGKRLDGQRVNAALHRCCRCTLKYPKWRDLKPACVCVQFNTAWCIRSVTPTASGWQWRTPASVTLMIQVW